MITTVNLDRDKHIETLDITNIDGLGKEKRKVKYPSIFSSSTSS